jgi:hypothetical protein
MLFLLVMEALSGLIRRADAWGLLQPLPSRLIPYHTSLNVDNLVLFLILVDTDLWITKCILSMYEKISVLGCNLGKCHIDPTKCEDSQVQLVQDLFPCPVTAFLMKYSVGARSFPVPSHGVPDEVFGFTTLGEQAAKVCQQTSNVGR